MNIRMYSSPFNDAGRYILVKQTEAAGTVFLSKTGIYFIV